MVLYIILLESTTVLSFWLKKLCCFSIHNATCGEASQRNNTGYIKKTTKMGGFFIGRSIMVHSFIFL